MSATVAELGDPGGCNWEVRTTAVATSSPCPPPLLYINPGGRGEEVVGHDSIGEWEREITWYKEKKCVKRLPCSPFHCSSPEVPESERASESSERNREREIGDPFDRVFPEKNLGLEPKPLTLPPLSSIPPLSPKKIPSFAVFSPPIANFSSTSSNSLGFLPSSFWFLSSQACLRPIQMGF